MYNTTYNAILKSSIKQTTAKINYSFFFGQDLKLHNNNIISEDTRKVSLNKFVGLCFYRARGQVGKNSSFSAYVNGNHLTPTMFMTIEYINNDVHIRLYKTGKAAQLYREYASSLYSHQSLLSRAL